ncbi:MAG: hypothetical protein M0023_03430 [Desulfobacteraceae bacterium]|nr:hypothetical protein [Desulfobacteraceae bacterium]
MNCSPSRIPEPAGKMPEELLARLSPQITDRMGLYFPPARWQTLENAFCLVAMDLGFQDPVACANWFISTPISRELVESLAVYLTVGETYFLREDRSFEIFTDEIIPEIIRKRGGGEQRLRIWSAGCATGEESYSIAILLARMRHFLHDWPISILATDINPRALRKAKEGVYTEWSFRTTPPWLKERYFEKCGHNRWALIPAIKKMVDFSYLNLAEDPYPSLPVHTNAMDVIFCRNVLMYFTPDLARKVVERFHRSLVDGGWLIVSPCESSQVLYPQFKAVKFPGAVFYQKQSPGTDPQGASAHEAQAWSATRSVEPLPVKERSPLLKSVPALRTPVPQGQTDFEAARSLYEKGLYLQAEQKLAPLLPPSRQNIRETVLMCHIHANQGKLAEARQLLEQAILADKLNPGLHNLRAMILQEQGDDHEAAVALKRALYLDQDLVLAHFSLANIGLRQGKHRESRRHFAQVLALLDRYRPDEVIPESDGMQAWRLREIIKATTAGIGQGDE